MFILKFLFKIILLPVLLILEIFRLLMKAGIKVYSLVLGIMMIVILGCLLYMAWTQMWTSVLILAVAEILIIAFAFLSGIVEGMIANTCERLKAYL